MSRDTPGTRRALVWVFFTERDGEKQQVHYLNNQEVASGWSDSLYRAIRYECLGEAGRPQGVMVHFNDRDGRPVEIEIEADARPLRPGALTDQSGHAATRHFLVFFRGQEALAVRNRVVMAGEDFSFNTTEGVVGPYVFRAAYSSNVYIVTLPFTTTRFRYEHEQFVSASGRVFVQTSSGEHDPRLAVGAAVTDTSVTLTLNPKGSLQTYAHQASGHLFTIRFDPPLVVEGEEHSAQVTYRMSLDSFPDLVTGQLHIRSNGMRVILEWRHASPPWSQNYPFASIITCEESGDYRLEVKSLR